MPVTENGQRLVEVVDRSELVIPGQFIDQQRMLFVVGRRAIF